MMSETNFEQETKANAEINEEPSAMNIESEAKEPPKSNLVWSSMNGELIISNCDFTGAKMSPENERLIKHMQGLNQ